jgi:cell division FtsZ-interacting protein ZapD
MADSPYAVAKNLFVWAKDNAKRTAQIQQAYDEGVPLGALTRGGLDSITNGTKNGVSMSKIAQLSENDRHTALRLALDWLKLGFYPSSSRSMGRF